MEIQRKTDNPRIRIDEQLLEIARRKQISKITLYTERGDGSCPLACSYCMLAKMGERRTMPLEVLFDAIDWIREVAVDKPAIHFFGTEPLKQWQHIVMARSYAPDIAISMTSNGYLLDEEKINWLADNDVRIYVYSIDGGPEHHDKHRYTRSGKGSWERVARNLQLLLQSKIGQYVTARGTWMPDDYDLVGRFKAIEALGAKYITFIPVIEAEGWDESKVAQAYIELADYYEGGPAPMQLLEDLIQEVMRGEGTSLRNKCNVGHSSWNVTVDGSLHLCHLYEEHDYGRLGSIYEGITHPEVLEISEIVDSFHTEKNPYPKEECRTCFAYKYCMGAGFCGQINHETTGRPDVPPDGHCIHLRGMLTGARYWAGLRQRKDPNSVLNNIGIRWEIPDGDSREPVREARSV